MKTSKENKRLISWLLSLALVFSVLGGTGVVKAETVGQAGTGGASARAASGPAVTSFTGKISYFTGTFTVAVTGGAIKVQVNSTPSTNVNVHSGNFTYNASPAISAGPCEITVEWNNCKVTKKINLTAETNTLETNPALNFVVARKANTVIKEDTDIGAIVDDKTMAKQFSAPVATDDHHGITQDDLDKASANSHDLFLYMHVKDYDPALTTASPDGITVQHRTDIQERAASDGSSILEYYSIYMDKRAQPKGGGSGGVSYDLSRSNDLVKIQIPLKASSLNKTGYIVYRHHEGHVQTVGVNPNEQGEYIEVDQAKKLLTLYVKNYCLYTLASLQASGPIWYPTVTATAVPTAAPTEEPAKPTEEPTKEPEATAEPTIAPTDIPPVPTVVPTAVPTEPSEPTAAPAKVKVKKLLLEATKITSTKTKLVWETLPDAEGYDLYQSKCNTGTKTYKVKYARTFKDGEKHTYLLKGLKKGLWYKNRIYAWKMVDGKKVIIGKSLIVHHYHKKNKDKTKWSNPTGIKLSKTKISLAKGKTAKLSAKALVPSKKSLGKHGKKIRYVVSNETIASVSENGKVKAKKKGTCTIYVVAQSGLKKKVKVTVK